ncbi:MAG: YicC family protein, partial [Marivivens sp.]|nr:YicC family protein [Marivivens sp.]
MIRSMTAFASRTGAHGGTQWSWDIRSVNARGLDLRLRLPDGIEGLEQSVRASLTKRFSRGNITLNLRLTRDETDKKLDVDTAALDRALEAIGRIEA